MTNYIFGPEKKSSVRFLSVSSGPTCLLIVALERRREPYVRYGTYLWFVYTHPEGAGSYDNPFLIG